MKAWAAALAFVVAGPVCSQEDVAVATGAVLRGLDKVDGDVIDLKLRSGESAEIGRLSIEVRECRYPRGEAAADAYAYLTIRDLSGGTVVFGGWMIASSPALNALEHARYDIWVLRCITD